MAATGGNEIIGREEGQTSGPMPVKPMIDGSDRRLLDRWLESVVPMPRAEHLNVAIMDKTDSRHHAVRGVICRLEDIESADWRLFFSHLAASDIRYRFGRLVSVEAGLRLLTLPNRYGSVIFGAFRPEGLVGVANLANDDIGRAEIAILIRSDRKRRGIGAALMRAALCQATQEHLQVYGFIEPSNAAIVGLMRRFGFVHGARQIDPTIMHWRPAEAHRRRENGGRWGSGKQTGVRPPIGARSESGSCQWQWSGTGGVLALSQISAKSAGALVPGAPRKQGVAGQSIDGSHGHHCHSPRTGEAMPLEAQRF